GVPDSRVRIEWPNVGVCALHHRVRIGAAQPPNGRLHSTIFCMTKPRQSLCFLWFRRRGLSSNRPPAWWWAHCLGWTRLGLALDVFGSCTHCSCGHVLRL